MNIKKLTPLVAIAAITLASITACKKDPNSSKSPIRIRDEKERAARTDMFNRISAYPYWKATAITTDTPVDIYKKGPTTDIFSQRPEHQTDYFISVRQEIRNNVTERGSWLHFGPKTIEMKKNNLLKNGYTEDQINRIIRDWKDVSISFSNGMNNQLEIEWVQPFFADPKYTHSMVMYKMSSFQNNELKLYYFDTALKTTVRVTFTGSKTIPQ